MTPPDYADWPFRPENRSDEQQTRWWRDCYVEAAADRRLGGARHWFLLSGRPGSGKSVALTTWIDDESGRALVLPYPPEHWPGSPTAWFPDNPDHLAQMMAVAGLAVAELLRQDSELAAGLDDFQLEFLRALLEYMGGPRHYRRFVAGLPSELAERYLAVEADTSFFADSRSLRGVRAQIEELAELLRGLGRDRAVFVIDPSNPLAPAHLDGLVALIGRLDLADLPSFVVAAVVSDDLLRDGYAMNRARGRVGLVYTDWTTDECLHVAERHLRAALNDDTARLTDILSADVISVLHKLVDRLYGAPSPAGWVDLTETALYLTRRAAERERLLAPLRAADLETLQATYFARHVRLRLDLEHRAVWRGPLLIPLTDQSYRLLELLFRREGKIISWYDDDDLRNLAGSPGNVHSIVSRTREAIEPIPNNWVYLRNKRGDAGGYWLENCETIARPDIRGKQIVTD